MIGVLAVSTGWKLSITNYRIPIFLWSLRVSLLYTERANNECTRIFLNIIVKHSKEIHLLLGKLSPRSFE
jgi:hypothetical protein